MAVTQAAQRCFDVVELTDGMVNGDGQSTNVLLGSRTHVNIIN